MKKIGIEEIEGFRIGQAKDENGATGVTVVISDEGATGAVDVRGGGPATRETDLLKPENSVQKINAVVLSGGSAFGLESGSGVMRYLKDNKVGFELGPYRVPIVVGASIFDLNCGNPDVFPDVEMGYQAAKNSENSAFVSGNEGAGTGATVSKMNGFENAVKSGVGSCALQLGDLKVGAVVVVNAVGEIIKPSHDFLTGFNPFQEPLNSNTTIGVILTNADLNKAELTKVCVMAQDGLARVIWPSHTPNDGDSLFAMSTNQVKADLTLVGMLAAQAVEGAILDAVYSAEPAYGLPSISKS